MSTDEFSDIMRLVITVMAAFGVATAYRIVDELPAKTIQVLYCGCVHESQFSFKCHLNYTRAEINRVYDCHCEVREGEPLRLMCVADAAWEWCHFVNRGYGSGRDFRQDDKRDDRNARDFRGGRDDQE